jgi:hypothetical protein
VGEHVFWTHPVAGFEMPPEAVQKQIKQAAQEAKLDLLTLDEKK